MDISTSDAIGRVLCHTRGSVDHALPYSVAVSSCPDCLRRPCDALVRLARKARGVASDDEAEAAAGVATLASEVRACLVSIDLRAWSVSRIEVSPPPLRLTTPIMADCF